jgi:putative ABC transport system ATP-binding protein
MSQTLSSGSRASRSESSNGSRPPDGTPLIELRDVAKAYPTPAGAFLALKNVSLCVESGEFVTIMGQSGSGKSTLLNIIAGIDRPTGGTVHVAGTAVHTLKEKEIAPWRGRQVGVVFQFFQLLPTLTCLENVVLPMDFCHTYPPRERLDRARALLDRIGMLDQADKLPSALSGGQQQRVAIARALANDPVLLLADEPTGNLDSRTADDIFALFESFVADRRTVLMVTHEEALARRTQRIITIHDGAIVHEDRPVLAPVRG